VGPYVAFHIILIGFFVFGALHYLAQWWLARDERLLLGFSIHCATSALWAACLVGVVTATSIRGSQLALQGRAATGLLVTATSLWLVSRVTGVRKRRFVTAVMAFCIAVAFLAMASAVVEPFGAPSGEVGRIHTWWGESLSFPLSRPGPTWLIWPSYGVVLFGYGFTLVAAASMWQRDRLGAVLVGLANVVVMVGGTVGLAIDVFRVPLPYTGAPSSAVWLILFSILVSREYARRGELVAAGDRRFRAIFDHTFQFIGLMNADGTLLEANRTALAFAGVEAEQVIGRSLWDTPWWTHSPPLQERLRAAVREAAAGQTVRFEATHPQREGGLAYVDFSLKPVRDERGAITLLIPEGRDITERKRAEDALAVTEARYRTLIDAAPEAIVVLDVEDGRFVDCNRHACELFGVSATAIQALGPVDLSPPVQPDGRESAIAAVDYLAQTISGANPVFAWTHCASDGRHIPCEVRLVRLPDPRRLLVRGSITDITGRLQLEEQLRQAQKMEAIGQLAGGVAHDFNNLLTVIGGYCELLLGKLSADDRLSSHVRAIADAGARASAVTHRLLAFSRRAVLAPKVLNINTVATDAEHILRRLIGEDIHLRVVMGQPIRNVKVDPNHLSQVLMNLAVNSRDAMPKGGTLTIETGNLEPDGQFFQRHADARIGPYVRLVVSDTGIGMTPDIKARVFEPFYTSKGVGHGTGLGLAVAHGIVKQSGGQIDVESEPGVGTTFTIYLPAVDEAEAGTGPASDSPAVRGQETILLVEDEESLRDLVVDAMEAKGFTVLSAANGREALQFVDAHRGPIDLLVTDVVMPHVDGRDLADQLRARLPGLKVLFMSGYMEDAMLRRGIFQAQEAFLQKPFALTSLGTKIRELLDGR
jgi:PAS domain S-box-containing protein